MCFISDKYFERVAFKLVCLLINSFNSGYLLKKLLFCYYSLFWCSLFNWFNLYFASEITLSMFAISWLYNCAEGGFGLSLGNFGISVAIVTCSLFNYTKFDLLSLSLK